MNTLEELGLKIVEYPLGITLLFVDKWNGMWDYEIWAAPDIQCPTSEKPIHKFFAADAVGFFGLVHLYMSVGPGIITFLKMLGDGQQKLATSRAFGKALRPAKTRFMAVLLESIQRLNAATLSLCKAWNFPYLASMRFRPRPGESA